MSALVAQEMSGLHGRASQPVASRLHPSPPRRQSKRLIRCIFFFPALSKIDPDLASAALTR